MKTNTATAVTFSDDWDDEPTVVDRWRRVGDTALPKTTGWATMSDDVLVALLRSSDDPTAVTHQDLPAVRS
jgi:hypothetical protein